MKWREQTCCRLRNPNARQKPEIYFPFPATQQRRSCIGVSHGFYTPQVNLFISVKKHFSHISVETDLLQKGDFSNCFQESRCAVSQLECYSAADYSKTPWYCFPLLQISAFVINQSIRIKFQDAQTGGCKSINFFLLCVTDLTSVNST